VRENQARRQTARDAIKLAKEFPQADATLSADTVSLGDERTRVIRVDVVLQGRTVPAFPAPRVVVDVKIKRPFSGPVCSGVACQSETLTATPGDNGLSPTLKAVRSCDMS
jgi:hypothetical protein